VAPLLFLERWAHHIGFMIYLGPIIITVLFALVSTRLSAWRTNRMLDDNSRPLNEPAITQLAARMAKTLGLPSIKVHVFEDPSVNGLAAPDGRIFITRGFLDRLRSGHVTAEELASVVAHELGHVALGHSKRRMIDFTGQNVMFVLLSGVLNRFLPGVGTLVAQFVAGALMARLSQRDEYEADAYATALMLKSGIGATHQKSLFRKLEALTGGRQSAVPAWMLSHPKTADRIAAIEANERKWLQG
jgi:metalloprotease